MFRYNCKCGPGSLPRDFDQFDHLDGVNLSYDDWWDVYQCKKCKRLICLGGKAVAGREFTWRGRTLTPRYAKKDAL